MKLRDAVQREDEATRFDNVTNLRRDAILAKQKKERRKRLMTRHGNEQTKNEIHVLMVTMLVQVRRVFTTGNTLSWQHFKLH